MGRGPSLAKVGAEHPADWIVEHVRNPKAHKQQSRMPAFEGKIGEADLKALGDFLASLKGGPS
jgi:cbb3-type cytochrome oxidase cytochrome c subunit